MNGGEVQFHNEIHGIIGGEVWFHHDIHEIEEGEVQLIIRYMGWRKEKSISIRNMDKVGSSRVPQRRLVSI